VSADAARYAGPFGRLLIALLFLLSGLGKLAAPAATIDLMLSAGLPFAHVGFFVALVLEMGGGVLLVAGYHTRLTGLLLALYSIMTALVFHHAIADQDQFFHFFKNLAIAGGLLQLTALGAGRLSLDAWRMARLASPATEAR
jgi:putative oxidoreductase